MKAHVYFETFVSIWRLLHAKSTLFTITNNLKHGTIGKTFELYLGPLFSFVSKPAQQPRHIN